MGAVLMMPLTMLAGGATDYARMRQVQSEVQGALDSAMLAAMKAPAAERAGKLRGVFAAYAPPGQTWPQPSYAPHDDGSATAQVTVNAPTAFLSMAAIASLPARATAVAAPGAPGANTVCITTLGAAVTGFTKGSNSSMAIKGESGGVSRCKFHVRSTANPSASIAGSGDITVSQFCIAGSQVSRSGTGAVTYATGCTPDQAYNPVVVTPSNALSAPCTYTNPTWTTGATARTLQPGVYCGLVQLGGSGGWTLASNAAGDPYIFRSAPGVASELRINGSGEFIARGVSFYFVDGGTMNMTSGSGQRTFTAPSSGPYKGILFQEPAGLSVSSFPYDIGVRTLYEGVINLPSRNLAASAISGSPGSLPDKVAFVVNSFNIGATAGTLRIEPYGLTSAADPAVGSKLKG